MDREKMRNENNPLVFMEVSIDGDSVGQLVIELYADLVPKTANNFRALCTGEMGIGETTNKLLHYKGSLFHRIHPNVYADGGDFENNDGTGGESIYGGTFECDKYQPISPKRGQLYMAHDLNKHDSKFIILFREIFTFTSHQLVGKVIEGMETLKRIEKMGTIEGKPLGLVKVTDCGQICEDKKDNLIESEKGDKEKGGKRVLSSNESYKGPVKKRGSTLSDEPVM